MFSKVVVLFLLQLVRAQDSISITNSIQHNNGCKCAPTDKCWPSLKIWEEFNKTISGKLIADTPPAITCYPGPIFDNATCAALVTQLTNSTFIAESPVALAFPPEDACTVVNYAAGETPGTCSIGTLPRYAINATSPEDVAAGVQFAKCKNIRLVIRNTGHDSIGRSTGYGSMEVWIHHLRQGITFQDSYTASDGCTNSDWRGSALKIGGGYIWGEAYAVAEENNVIVVGGGDPSVGCIGGWAQGGGHSPASHDFGLGADQILEAEVVLANGTTVTANSCQNSDLYSSIRGGGGGTYGIVTSTTVKTRPTANVSAQTFIIAPLDDKFIPEFMSALEIMYSSFPYLSEGGISGYGNWAYQSFGPVISGLPYTTGYQHSFAIMDRTVENFQEIWASVASKLSAFNGTSLYVSTNYDAYPNYATFYNARQGQAPVGQHGAFGSRLFDRAALTSPQLKEMLNVTAGLPGQFTQRNFCFVSGGQVFEDGSDPFTGVNPAWRTSYLHDIVARGYAADADSEVRAQVHGDITYVKIGSMKALAPNTGCYMNEADGEDPEYLRDFYGDMLGRHVVAKVNYDPESVFYCPTCVGSDAWKEDETGRLCRV